MREFPAALPAMPLPYLLLAIFLALLPWLVLWGVLWGWQVSNWLFWGGILLAPVAAHLGICGGLFLTDGYSRWFKAPFPGSLELGGLFIAMVLAMLYPWGLVWGYLIGFRAWPFPPHPLGQGLLMAALAWLWTVGVFFWGYRWALRAAKRL